MPAFIAMLRGVNLGPHRRIKMEALRETCQKLKLRDSVTYLQSGNVVFRTDEQDLDGLTQCLQKAIARKFGFSSDVILRTASEMRKVIAANPFAKRRDIEPSRLLVTFLANDPGEDARKLVRKMKTEPEEVWIDGREIYTYFPNGMARPTVSWAAIERVLKTSGTARNWNSVTKLLEIAEKLEATR